MTRQEAIDIIKVAQAEVEWDYPLDYMVAFRKAVEALSEPEIIRCKDCKHWDEKTAIPNHDFGFRTAVCGLLSGIDTWGEYPETCFHKNEDWYCADAERKANEE